LPASIPRTKSFAHMYSAVGGGGWALETFSHRNRVESVAESDSVTAYFSLNQRFGLWAPARPSCISPPGAVVVYF